MESAVALAIPDISRGIHRHFAVIRRMDVYVDDALGALNGQTEYLCGYVNFKVL